MALDSVVDLREAVSESYRLAVEQYREAEQSGNLRLKLAASAEMRRHLALAIRAKELAARPKEVEEFEATVLKVLEEADPALRAKVIDAIDARCGKGPAAALPETEGDDYEGLGWDIGEDDAAEDAPDEEDEDPELREAGERSPPGEPEYLTTREAAGVLGITTISMSALARRGRITRVRHGNGYAYPREAVMAMAEKRRNVLRPGERRLDERVWGPRNRPVEHTDLVTVREAAAYLGITKNGVWHLIDRGMLPCYQDKPHNPGSVIKIPRYYMEALARRPTYCQLRSRAASRRPAEIAILSGHEEWSILPIAAGEKRRTIRLNHGDYYSTSQAAEVLGIHVAAVHGLAKRGRLTAIHRRKRCVIQSGRHIGAFTAGNRWLFFRKEEVHALLEDPQYRERRAAVRLGQSPERKAEREAAIIERWARDYTPMRRPNVFGEIAVDVRLGP